MGTEGFLVPASVHACHEERRNPAPVQPRGLDSEEREGQIPSDKFSRSSKQLDWGLGFRAPYHNSSMQTGVLRGAPTRAQKTDCGQKDCQVEEKCEGGRPVLIFRGL